MLEVVFEKFLFGEVEYNLVNDSYVVLLAKTIEITTGAVMDVRCFVPAIGDIF